MNLTIVEHGPSSLLNSMNFKTISLVLASEMVLKFKQFNKLHWQRQNIRDDSKSWYTILFTRLCSNDSARQYHTLCIISGSTLNVPPCSVCSRTAHGPKSPKTVSTYAHSTCQQGYYVIKLCFTYNTQKYLFVLCHELG